MLGRKRLCLRLLLGLLLQKSLHQLKYVTLRVILLSKIVINNTPTLLTAHHRFTQNFHQRLLVTLNLNVLLRVNVLLLGYHSAQFVYLNLKLHIFLLNNIHTIFQNFIFVFSFLSEPLGADSVLKESKNNITMT